MNTQHYEMTILVDGKPIPEYQHDGNTFVEGRSGTDYKIRVRNNTFTRTCFVVSVDGLSVINGKDAADQSPGYILNAYETLEIACYKVDDTTGAKFVFGSKDKSYSAEIGKGTDNVGVIAMRVFRERVKPIQQYHSATHRYPRGVTGMAASASLGNGSAFDWIQSNSIYSVETKTGGTLRSNQPVVNHEHTDMEETKLGTVFGESMLWQTQTVMFDREALPVSSMAIYYDTRKNLERRGVKFTREAPSLPNPFPANESCAIPPGWRK